MTAEDVTAQPATARPAAAGPVQPLVQLTNICKYFLGVTALEDINFPVYPGEVMCLLGDNGAGKSTLIKILSGVHQQDKGTYWFDGQARRFSSPREAKACGIATVYQDLSMIPLMSISRNFWLGSEPTRGVGPLRFFDGPTARRVAREELARIGIRIRDADQLVGTLSGGERQCVAIARAKYFGAKLLILDEPTSALGVREARGVLRYVRQARDEGLGVVLITHNVNHAYPVGDRFTVLGHGHSLGTFTKDEVSREDVLELMAGGEDLADVGADVGVDDGADAGADAGGELADE
ncbi:MAG: simple sugar transport system ATP-binding protein [Pseudonocardiales bacterium]|nr:simple sugar transport system ATP-binding protein [Pseudonocardiales bacterium]